MRAACHTNWSCRLFVIPAPVFTRTSFGFEEKNIAPLQGLIFFWVMLTQGCAMGYQISAFQA
jgi:hypothetical protein